MLSIVILIAFTVPISCVQSEKTLSLEELTETSNKFAIHLYQAVKSGASGNLVLSPMSTQILLRLAGQGARGVTAKSSLLHQDLTDIKLLEAQQALLDSLTQNTNLNVANRMFIDTSFKVKPDFQRVADTYFLSGLETTDYVKNPEDARKSRNNWVEGNTNNLLGPGVITSMTRTVLVVSATHFKGMWSEKFNPPTDTQEAPFHVGPSQTVPLQMMSQIGKKFYAKLLGMPYEMSSPPMGMVATCSDSADFSGTAEEPPSVDAIVQKKPDIEVNEEGTEAAAAAVLEKALNNNDIVKILQTVLSNYDEDGDESISEDELKSALKEVKGLVKKAKDNFDKADNITEDGKLDKAELEQLFKEK